MKVAIVCDSLYGYISGVVKFASRLISQLDAHEKVEQVVVLTGGRKFRIVKEGNVKIYFFPGINSRRFKDFTLGTYPLHVIPSILKKEEIDIVHAQLPTFICTVAVRSAKKMGIPVVFTSHTQPENILKNIGIELRMAKRAFYRFMAWLYSFADIITCPSTLGQQELIENGIKDYEQTVVISNGLDAGLYKPTWVSKKEVLFVGRVMKEKCIDTLLRATKIFQEVHPDFRTVIVGDGFSKPELEELAKELEIDVEFAGRLDDDELLKRHQESYMFVLPSESELQGIALMEAMSCGKPTIASDSPMSASGALANFTFPHNNHSDLAEKICYLIENPDEAEKLGRVNRLTIENEHDYSKIIGKYLGLYDRLIEEKTQQKEINYA